MPHQAYCEVPYAQRARLVSSIKSTMGPVPPRRGMYGVERHQRVSTLKLAELRRRANVRQA